MTCFIAKSCKNRLACPSYNFILNFMLIENLRSKAFIGKKIIIIIIIKATSMQYNKIAILIDDVAHIARSR